MGENSFALALCELFNPSIHGFDNSNDANVITHFLVIDVFDDDEDTEEIDEIIENHEDRYDEYPDSLTHPMIRNYRNIISNYSFLQPQIVKIHYLRGDECVAIIKTFWLKIIQRSWKNIYKKRREIIRQRSMLSSLQYRETTGKWPDTCQRLPSITGMLMSSPFTGE